MMTPRDEARRAMALTIGFDAAMAALAMGVALPLRWTMENGAPTNPLQTTLMAAGVFALSAILAFWIVGVHRQVWRHMGWLDAVRVTQAVGLAALIFLPILFLWNRLVGFPRSSLIVALPLWLILLFAGRMIAIARTTKTPFQIFRPVRRDAPLVLLVGDGERAAEVLRDLERAISGPRVRILGLIDVNESDPGRAIRGVPVMGGLEDLGNVLDILTVRYNSAPWVAATGAARERGVMDKILEETASRGSKVMALEPGERRESLQQIRPADLLARPERGLDLAPVSKMIEGANVFVTGAGGTIGSELARQCAALEPKTLALFEASEFNLYSINRTIEPVAERFDVSTFLGDVRDTTRLDGAMRAVRPDVVIHAAALKHVPLMEANVCEAILTNVAGTLNAVRAAQAAGAKRFVLISTDKAVDPDNVMGATKRLAELACCQIAQQSDMDIAMVRFGNVLGSSGSVVPLFEEQIERGGPVTVTDPEVTRYFMTVEEASSLVLQAAALNGDAEGRSLFVLDMGEPVKISALAEAMIRLKGLVPDRDIKIEYTGLRAGEKLHEVLTYDDEDVKATRVPGVLSVAQRTAPMLNFEAMLEGLIDAAQRRDRVEALRLLSQLVPEYTAHGQDFRARKRA